MATVLLGKGPFSPSPSGSQLPAKLSLSLAVLQLSVHFGLWFRVRLSNKLVLFTNMFGSQNATVQQCADTCSKLCQWFGVSHDGSVYTMEISKLCTS